MKLNVGRIGKAHGILGEATIEVRTDDAEHRFAIGAAVETENKGKKPLKELNIGLSNTK